MQPIFTDEERGRVDAAVEDAERQTNGEIVPVVVRASDDYPGARWRLAVAFTIGVTAIALLFLPLHPFWVIVSQAPALLFGHWLATRPALLRLALSDVEIEEEVKQRAHQCFLELGLTETKERTGVLLFVTLLEHRIEIVADAGIDRAAPQGFWDEVVGRLRERLRRGEVADGVAEGVGAVGALLAEKFPRRTGDADELPSRVVTE